jgi:hypothetical protein
MIFKRINRDNPEQIFITVKNGYDTASLTSGQAVMWDFGDGDGVNVTRISNSANKTLAFAGIVVETIVAGEFGLLQIWGYNAAVNVRMSGTTSIYTGAALYADVSGFRLNTPTQASGFTGTTELMEVFPAAFALEGYTTTTAADITVAAFIKAM